MTYYGQLEIDSVLHNKYFLNKTNGTFIECGAFDGVMDSNTLFFYNNLKWRGINIEPLPNIYQHLIQNRVEDININMALSDTDGVKMFTQAISTSFVHYSGHFGNGSLEHTETHMQELQNRGCSFESFEIKTISIPTLYEQYQINKQIDLFVLDVEGHEAKVLSQLHKINKSLFPKIITTEYGHCGEEEIKNILLPLGYTIDHKDAINIIFKME